VIRIGAVAAWVVVALFLIIALVTGQADLVVRAAGPAAVAVIMTTQAALGRENAGSALMAAFVAVVVSYAFLGDEATLLPAALGAVIIASVAMLFVRRNRLLVTIVVAILMIAVPQFWGTASSGALSLGLVMALTFGVSAAIFYTVGNAATALNRRFQVLFEHSPTPVLEADWSESLNYLQSEFSGRRNRIRGFLGAYPDIVSHAVSLVDVIRANQAAFDLLGVKDPDRLLGTTPEGQLPRSWVDALAEVLIALFEGRSFTDYEFRAPSYDGKDLWLNARFVDASAGDRPDGVLVAFSDITHLKAKEDAMQDLIRSKDEFVASISHELRTPLTAVVGLTSEMSGGDLSASEKDELIELVADQAKEMSHIIDDLLVAARTEMGTVAVAMSDIDLVAQLTEAVDGVGIHLEEMPEHLPLAIGDGHRVRQILRNLLTNMERYGGIHRRALGGVERSRVWLEIRDDGAGVPEGETNSIFEPYASAHTGVASSVGLGLSVARQLAHLMGGTLTYSRDGNESVFRLELGLAEESLLV
jgi:signal transduction histidine kinase